MKHCAIAKHKQTVLLNRSIQYSAVSGFCLASAAMLVGLGGTVNPSLPVLPTHCSHVTEGIKLVQTPSAESPLLTNLLNTYFKPSDFIQECPVFLQTA